MKTIQTRTAALGLAGLIILATACGNVHASQTTAASGESPRQRAVADAAANLASFTAPPGTRRITRVPVAASEWLKQPPLTTGQIDDVSYWQVAQAPVTVLTWIHAHLPRRYRLTFSGTEGGLYMTPYSVASTPRGVSPGALSVIAPRAWWDEFSLPAMKGVLPVRVLVVSVSTADTGQTVIRVDAQDSWSMTRSSSQRVPANVTSVTITRVRSGGPIMVGGSVTVTEPATVRRTADLTNSLPMYATNVPAPCPVPLTAALELQFRDAINGPVAATATANPGECGTVSLTVGNRAPIVLGDAATFVRTLESLVPLPPGYSTSTGTVNPGGPVVMAP